MVYNQERLILDTIYVVNKEILHKNLWFIIKSSFKSRTGYNGPGTVFNLKLQGNENNTIYQLFSNQKCLKTSFSREYCTYIHLRDLFYMISIIVHTTEQ